ncbi:MAG: NAD-dependent deacylase [Tannerellaceae bacterium]|jgi:NAD-dependent deacetylase|nr:NAD-dependent deacylase [Tannerellaceae bacterium]
MKKIVVLTGAGMSAESGISTFRDSNGLWEEYRVEDVATPEAFAKNPALVLDFYNQRRRQLLGAEPNGGHYGLVELEKDFEVRIVTQNVDDLHERAGSTSVLHLHGELMKVCPADDMKTTYELSAERPEIGVGDTDERGVQLRPFIVWFGEPVPMIMKAAEIVEQADVCVVIGTSLQVYPAAGLLNYVRRGTPIYLIDPKPVPTVVHEVRIIKTGATEGVRQLAMMLEDYV